MVSLYQICPEISEPVDIIQAVSRYGRGILIVIGMAFPGICTMNSEEYTYHSFYAEKEEENKA